MTATEQATSYDETFGQAIRRHREAKGWSMTEFASVLSDAGLSNFHATTVSRLEAGTRAVRLAEAIVIAGILGLSLDAISTPPAHIGQNVRHYREVAGMTQSQLAKALGGEGIQVQKTTVSKIESGARSLEFREGMAIARILNIDPSDLVPA